MSAENLPKPWPKFDEPVVDVSWRCEMWKRSLAYFAWFHLASGKTLAFVGDGYGNWERIKTLTIHSSLTHPTEIWCDVVEVAL